VIVPEVGWVRDSLAAMALVLELLATEGRSLSSIVDEFPKYSMLKMKLDLSSISGRSAIDPALEKLRSHFASARITDVDGIRIDLDEGWAHVRASNTEPILRVITEASTPSDAKKLCQDVIKASGLD
jgi:phosphomannomutase